MKRKKSNSSSCNADLFDKMYVFKGNERWQLPEQVFRDEKWAIPSLQTKKRELNAVKEQLGQFDLSIWSLHTKKRDPSTQIIKTIRKRYNPELLTQAWCKFYECLSRTNLIPPEAVDNGRLNSLHLCEAPGGFISALNHFLRIKHPNIKLVWLASTLNPEYEGNPTNRMIPDDRLIAFTKESWLFGADHTGDIMKYYNYMWMVETVIERAKGKMDLITADGSINCMDDPGDQERHVEHLHFCEVISALTLLKTGGHFVLKIFTSFEDSTVSLLYLLNCLFASISIVKPLTSKSGNSETYVLCQSYKGIHFVSQLIPPLLQHYANIEINKSKALFSLCDINAEFLRQIDECTEYFMRKQCLTINENIKYFCRNSIEYNNRLYRHNNEVANDFLRLHDLAAIESRHRLVGDCELKFYPVRSFQSRDNSLFMYYHHKNMAIKLNFLFGKKLEQVLYTKYAQIDDFHRFRANIEGKVNVQREVSLYHLCKRQLARFYAIIDCSEFPANQSQMHHRFLDKLTATSQSNKVFIIINVQLVSHFLVGLLYVLSQEYTIVFFKHGLIYLSKTCKENHSDGVLMSISDVIRDVSKGNNDFERDLLQLIDCSTYTGYFWKCVSFYNNYLC